MEYDLSSEKKKTKQKNKQWNENFKSKITMKLLKKSPRMGSYYSLNLTSHIHHTMFLANLISVYIYIYISAKGLQLITKTCRCRKIFM